METVEWELCTAFPAPAGLLFLWSPSPQPLTCGRTLIPASFHTPQHTPLRVPPCPDVVRPAQPGALSSPRPSQDPQSWHHPQHPSRPCPNTSAWAPSHHHSPALHLSGAPAASSSSSSSLCASSDRLPRTCGLPLGSTHCTSTPGAMTLKTFMEGGVVWAPMPPSPEGSRCGRATEGVWCLWARRLGSFPLPRPWRCIINDPAHCSCEGHS